MTKQDKLFLYKTALEYIAEGNETHRGLCWLLQEISNSRKIDVYVYEELEMEVKNDLFTKPKLSSSKELTNQMVGKPSGRYWFPAGEWKERKQLLLNAINILENES